MKKVHACLRILLCSMISLFITLIYVEHDPVIIQKLEKSIIQQLSNYLGCHVQGKISQLSILTGTCSLNKMDIHSYDGAWSWNAAVIRCTYSWFDIIRYGYIPLDLDIFDLAIFSCFHNDLAIQSHVKLLLKKPDQWVPFRVARCTAHTLKCRLEHNKGYLSCNGTLDVQDSMQGTTVNIYMGQGLFSLNEPDIKIIQDMQLRIQAKIAEYCSGAINCSGTIAPFDQQLCLKGTFKDGFIDGICQSSCQDIMMTGSGCLDTFKLQGVLPLLQGALSFEIKKDQNYAVTAHAENLCINDVKISPLHATIFYDQNLSGTITLGSCHIIIENMNKYEIIHGDKHYLVVMNYDKPGEVSISINNKEHDLIYFSLLEDGQYKANIFVYPLLLSHEVPPDGQIICEGVITYQGCTGIIKSSNLFIRIPEIYNFIKDFECSYNIDFAHKQLSIMQAKLGLQQGSLELQRGNIIYHKDCSALFPLLIKDCFIGYDKSIFALFSGMPIITYKQGQIILQGELMLERAHMRDNVLACEDHAMHKLLTGHNKLAQIVLFDMHLYTKELAKIKTDLLEATARIGLHAQGTVHNPQIVGSIELIQGAFSFPYQPLYITRGKLLFEGYNATHPQVEILAKNVIKKYHLSMMIQGTLQNPEIQFASAPMLEREQIIALLFGGSEDGLFLALPKTLSESLHELFFGSIKKSNDMHHYLSGLFKPFKSIRIVPSFSDQRGRGGLRGSVVVEVDERLRALLEQNFSLTEDMRWQIEYDLSDDTTIRALKDEHGDVGAQLEMRWKF